MINRSEKAGDPAALSASNVIAAGGQHHEWTHPNDQDPPALTIPRVHSMPDNRPSAFPSSEANQYAAELGDFRHRTDHQQKR